MSADDRTFVIVGASLAGAKAAETLREEGFTGRVVLIGEETEPPYERPPLSKGYLLGRGAAGEGVRARAPVVRRARHRPACRAARSPCSTRPRTPSPWTPTEQLRYDKLLLATGSRVRTLDLPGRRPAAACATCARSTSRMRCCEAFERAAAAVVVVGAGWIGLETAAAARSARLRGHRGRDGLAAAAAGAGRRGRRASSGTCTPAHGVDFRFGAGVREFLGEGEVRPAVRARRWLRAGRRPGRVGVGIRPARRARRGGRAGGRQRHRHRRDLRTSDPDIFACGDVAPGVQPAARAAGLGSSTGPTPCNGGPAAARSMLGQEVAYDRVAVLLLRPVRPGHGVLRLGRRRRLRPGGVPRRPGVSTAGRRSSSRSGSDGGARAGRDERQRLGRHRPDPGPGPLPAPGRPGPAGRPFGAARPAALRRLAPGGLPPGGIASARRRQLRPRAHGEPRDGLELRAGRAVAGLLRHALQRGRRVRRERRRVGLRR